jgi:hypothetical protein
MDRGPVIQYSLCCTLDTQYAYLTEILILNMIHGAKLLPRGCTVYVRKGTWYVEAYA